MRCKRCGYILHGLSDHRCPECGGRFDPEDESTYLTKPVSGYGPLAGSVLALVMIVLPLLAAYLNDLGVAAPNSWLFVAPLAVMMPAGLIIACFTLLKAVRAVRGQLVWTAHDGAFAVAFVVSLLAVLGAFGMIVLGLLARVMS